MQNVLTNRLQELSLKCHKEPEQVIAEAIEIGILKMWVDVVLAQYLKKQISRRRAIRLVGLDKVKLAEHQDKIVQDDIQWGINYASNRS